MLVKPTPVLVIPGTPEVPGSAASTTCIPAPPADEEEPSPTTPPEAPVPVYLYVPNDPEDPNAGEVRTPWYEDTPAGYVCGYATFINYYQFGDLVITVVSRETRCYWEYPP